MKKPLKVQILSDLHLEFAPFELPETDADVIVLAGDIHHKGRSVDWALQATDKPVILVPGNHEYYGGSLGYTFEKMRAKAEGTHVHLLDKGSVVIGGVRFLGATLWTDFALHGNPVLGQLHAQEGLNDYRKIRNKGFGRLRSWHISDQHFEAKRFLTAALAESFEGKTVVVTHHAPSERSIPPQYLGHQLSPAYASRLEHLLGFEGVWVHGHLHDSQRYKRGGTEVICNPKGYGRLSENPDFDPGLVVEV